MIWQAVSDDALDTETQKLIDILKNASPDASVRIRDTLDVAVDNKTVQVSSDALRIKGITQTAVGDLLIGAASNGGYTRLAKPGSNDALLTMGTAGTASWTTTLDGGTF